MLVSVITVSYNSEDTIARTLKSVCGQTYRDIEYIIIDGGSTDKTMEIVRSYQAEFDAKGICYRYLSEKDNGIYDAMNKGIRMASGELVGIINSDDWYEPLAVETAVREYIREPYDLFYADLRIMDKKGSFIKKSKDSRWITSRYWNHPTTFIPRKIYDRYLYKNETIHDDWDLILRMRSGEKNFRVRVVNEVLADFCRNGVSHEKGIRKALKRAKIKYRIYRNNGYGRLYAIECYGMEIAKLMR